MPRPTLPEDLEPLDRMLDRWGSGSYVPMRGGLHPLERMRLEKEGALFSATGPIPTPDEYLKLDDIVRSSPEWCNALIVVWYRSDAPVIVKARRIGVSRTTIYERWKQALRWVQGAMHARGVAIIG